MGSITSYCVKVIKDNFKLLTWLQILIIAITPNFIFYQTANATTVASEGWSVTKRLVQGATTFYDGAKNVVLNGKNYAATGTAAITPAAGQVAKMIVRTGAVLAVDLAIKALIGAVDYTMDPANNQVKYYVSPPTASPSDQYYWSNGNSQNIKYSSSRAALDGHLAYLCASGGSWGGCPDQIKSIQGPNPLSYGASYIVTRTNNSTVTYNMTRIANPAYDPNAQPNREEKYLPYDAVASQVISDAIAEKAEGKAYVSSVADTALEDEQRQIVPASDVTQQLNNSQAIPTNGTGTGTATPTTGTGTGTGTGDPTAQPQPYDITINFPIFCNWAPTVCQAAQAGINYVASYTKDVDALKKEYGDNPKFDDKPLEFDKDPATPDTTISFGGGCPAPLNAPYSFMGISGSIEIPFTPFCKIAEVSKPVIIAVSAYFAALIIGGIRSGDA
ncbi:virulence factor TspB C-terminal domain-related protein [Acinetobacter baumannii]|nr:virulence factor TspB C-terminal domain-related protein [Acinetobacter baumannii]